MFPNGGLYNMQTYKHKQIYANIQTQTNKQTHKTNTNIDKCESVMS